MTPDLELIQKLEKALPAYVAKQRWFRAKTLTISEIKVAHYSEHDAFVVLLLNIHYAQGGSDLYLLPVTSVTTPNAEQANLPPVVTLETPEGNTIQVYDAVSSPVFRTLLFQTITNSAETAIASGKLVVQSLITPPPAEGIMESVVSRAEQSNTSIIYGREFILKLFRKLEPGINPDIEMGEFLTAQGFKNTPAVLATIEFQTNAGDTYSAAILQQFVTNEGDAWKYTLNSLAAYYKDSSDDLGPYHHSAQLLAVRTAQMHTALAASRNPDFKPEDFTREDASALYSEIEAQVQSSLQLIRENLASLRPSEQQLAQKVLALEPQIYKRFGIIGAVSTQAKRIRTHGDYHLGQVLYTGSDFMIIDFEGEPARPLDERRARSLALRDVAGMVRSFQYAAFGSLQGLLPDLTFSEELALRADKWYRQVSTLYLDSYFAEANSQLFIPSTVEQRQLFLDAFLLQKALYEVRYELNNRPTWVGIPLRGILSLIEP